MDRQVSELARLWSHGALSDGELTAAEPRCLAAGPSSDP